ncbi:MAG: hypothetical protein LUD19_04680 [Clostridia bacterium]|nr:hypothetical protein [Clostridia bacterium]
MKVFIGFDTTNSKIRILAADKNTEREYAFNYNSPVFSEEFFSGLGSVLIAFVNGNNIPHGTAAYLILPDCAVGLETFDLPYMSKPKMLKALETEFINEYGSLKDQKISRFFISSTKKYATYGVVFYDRKVVARLYKVISEAKLLPRAATFGGNALVNSTMHFMPRTRGKNFIVADIRNGYTQISVCSKGRTLGFAVYPHGLELIRCGEVCDEYCITDHSAAELVVINAAETAKAKSLTLSEAQPLTADDDEEGEEDFSVSDNQNVYAENSKIYRKSVRRLPKSMQREIPSDSNGIAYENFRIILKWILLYARQAKMTPYINDAEYVIVNLPQDLQYLIQMANEEQNGITLRPFKGAEKRSEALINNLDLYGAAFMRSFNRNSNY